MLNKIFKGAPGFGENQGYSIEMKINEDGSQDLIAFGKPFDGGEFRVNSSSLNDMLEAGIEPISVTPDIPTDMKAVAAGSGLFDDEMIGDKELKPNAKLDIQKYALRTRISRTKIQKISLSILLWPRPQQSNWCSP